MRIRAGVNAAVHDRRLLQGRARVTAGNLRLTLQRDVLWRRQRASSDRVTRKLQFEEEERKEEKREEETQSQAAESQAGDERRPAQAGCEVSRRSPFDREE